MKWFKHDSDAHRDARLKKVIMRYRAEGYALYWYCIELIASRLDKNNVSFELEEDAEIIAHDLGIDSLKVEEIMRHFVESGLFTVSEESNRIACLKLANRLDESASKNPQIRKLLNEAKVKGAIKSDKKGLVYVIRANDIFKIGMTTNLHRRLGDYKTTNPESVLIHTIESVDPSLLEARLHKAFKGEAATGEWFKLSGESVRKVLSIQDGDKFIQEGFPKDSGEIQKVSGSEEIRLDKNRLDKNTKDKKISAQKPSVPAAPKTKFTKPSLLQASEYFHELGSQVCNDDAQAFIDHFDSNGWKVGGRSPMKEWKPAIRTWYRNSQKFREAKNDEFKDQSKSISGRSAVTFTNTDF